MYKYLTVLTIVLAVAFPQVVLAAPTSIAKVSGFTPMTTNAEYDRNPSIVFDGSDYWLFWTKGDDTSTAGVRGSYNPDADFYVVYYKKASTLAGLAGAAETQLALSQSARPADFDQRVVSAVAANGDIYAFVSSGFGGGTDHQLYYYKYSGGSWTGPVLLVAGGNGAHVNATTNGIAIFIVWESGGGSDYYFFYPSTGTLTGPTTISTDNQPKIAYHDANIWVVSVQDGTGDIEVYLALGKPTPTFAAVHTAIPGAGLYDPVIIAGNKRLYVVSAPYDGPNDRQYLVQTYSSNITSTATWSPAKTVCYGGYGGSAWWEYWPVGYFDPATKSVYVFFTTESSNTSFSDGEIGMVKMDWDRNYDHYFHVQNAIDEHPAGSQIDVAAGTYAERVNLHKASILNGAQYTVDPTVPGSRMDPSAEAIIDITGLPVTNPNVVLEIPAGVVGAAVKGFTLIGSPTFHYADETVVRCWDDDVDLLHNIITGYIGVLHKGAADLYVYRNRVTVNKTGLVIQPNPASGVHVEGNTFALDSAPAADAAAMYMTGVATGDILNNTATGFSGGRGVGGSNLTDITVSGNTFDGCRDGISFWGTTTFVDIQANVLANSVRYGISIKGQDINITNNHITNSGFTGVYIDRHIGNTERVVIFDNEIVGSVNYGVQVNHAVVPEVVNASGNWWGTNTSAGVAACVTPTVDYTPYLDVGTDTADPGFQGDFSVLHVDAASPQAVSAVMGRINEGADMVTSSTVYVAPGTYPATVNLTTSFNGGTLSGDTISRPIVTGGMTLGSGLDDVTVEYMVFQGVGASNSVVRMLGPVLNLTMDYCVIDGEFVSGRHGFAGGQLQQDATITNCEFQNVLGWALFESYSGSGGGGSPLDHIVFAHNDIHDCNGSVVFRGEAAAWTPTVDIYDNDWSNIGGNASEQGQQWAACEVNRAVDVNMYDNTVDDVAMGVWGEGQAFQLWGITNLDVHDNLITNNAQGIMVYTTTVAEAVPGGSIYDNTITGNAGFGVTVEAGGAGGPLDAACNWWGTVDGPNDPPGNPSTGDDVIGPLVYSPWLDSLGGACTMYGADYVAGDPTGLCISTPTACVTMPVEFYRTDTTPARGATITIELSPELQLCVDPGTSIVQGSWLGGYGLGSTFQVLDQGGGVYIIDQAVLGGGGTCGPTGGGTLFTLDLTGPADATGTVSITSVDVRDCGNPFTYLPGIPGPAASVTIDFTAPGLIADLAAVQEKATNDTDHTTEIDLSWTAPPELDVASVELYRKGFGFYPEYDDDGGSVPAAPADPTAALAAGWTHVVSLVGAASAYTDEPGDRDYWYYVAFVIDDCGNISDVSNQTDGTLNYHLGDVAVSPGDSRVTGVDISALGAAYATGHGDGLYDNELDIGPTADNSTDGLPDTDNAIQFEDLMIMAINYGMVSKPQPGGEAADRNAIALRTERDGATITVIVDLASDGTVQGVSVPLTWNGAAVEPIGFVEGEFLGRQAGLPVMFSPAAGAVDAAMFGSTFVGEGELARITFRVIGSGSPGIALGEALARDPENRAIALAVLDAAGPVLPVQTRLLPSAPNPFLGATTITFALGEEGPVRIRIYSVDGRLVRTVVDDVLPAGEKTVQWDGRDDGGRDVASGAYLIHLEARGAAQSQRVVRLQ